MELPFTTPAAVANAYCVPWNGSDPLEPLYDQAAMQFDTDNDASLSAIIKVALQNQMMLYRKSQCSDCATQGLPPTQTVINPPIGIQTAAPAGAVPTNSTDSTISVVTGIAAKYTSGIPIVGQITAVINNIAGIFGAAHAQAVAEEQAVNCSVAYAFNKYVPQYDAAVASGQATAEAALAEVTQVIQQLIAALDPVISGNNWGWGARQVLMAHLWFRQQWYPMLESSVGSSVSGIASKLTASPILLVAILAGAVLLLGGSKKAAA